MGELCVHPFNFHMITTILRFASFPKAFFFLSLNFFLSLFLYFLPKISLPQSLSLMNPSNCDAKNLLAILQSFSWLLSIQDVVSFMVWVVFTLFLNFLLAIRKIHLVLLFIHLIATSIACFPWWQSTCFMICHNIFSFKIVFFHSLWLLSTSTSFSSISHLNVTVSPLPAYQCIWVTDYWPFIL